MPNIKIVGQWSSEFQKAYKIPKGYLLLKIGNSYRENLRKVFKKLAEFQKKNDTLKDLEITIEVHYKKRTLNQNRLMWAIYTIEANEHNGGMEGKKEFMVTPEDLYNSDLIDYAPKVEITIPPEQYNYYATNYRVENAFKTVNKEGKTMFYKMTLIESTSHFNTKQMAKWIDRQFNRLAQNGVNCTNPAQIYDYWLKWRNFINDQKIELYEAIISIDEYRKLNPICEATGVFIQPGLGHIAHIKARGMGGNHEIEKDYPSNLLHLSQEPHLCVQHQKGWGEFIKKYPHLKNKVEKALKREVKK